MLGMELLGARQPPAHDPALFAPGALPPPPPPPRDPHAPQPAWFYAPVAVHVNFVVDKIGALDRYAAPLSPQHACDTT